MWAKLPESARDEVRALIRAHDDLAERLAGANRVLLARPNEPPPYDDKDAQDLIRFALSEGGP